MINVSEEINKNIYYNVEECVNYCRSIPNTTYNEPIEYHIFWNVGLDFGRKQTLPIKSFLSTQNLKSAKLNLWSNVDLSDNIFLKPFLDLINIKIWDPIKESKNTPLEDKINYLTINDELNYCAGDLFRILVLHNYGGLYTDVDTVFLRDFGPLLNQEFMYKWSFDKKMINGAVIRMFKKSQLSFDLINQIIKRGIIPKSLNWSSNLYEDVRLYNKNWTVFPCGFFNTEWQIYLTSEQKIDPKYKDICDFIKFPFKKNKFSNEFYDGVFSWHWHNGWNDPIEEGSKWELLEKKFNKIILEKFKIEI